MKKFSKLFWVALVVVAVLACTAIGIFAADTTETTNAVVYGDFVDLTEVGDSFEVGFHFKENDTLVECGKITLTWDKTKLTAVSGSVAKGDALENAQFGSKIEDGKAVIAWAGSDIKDTVKEGDLFTVTFTKVSADVTDALIDVTVDDFGYTTETYKSVDMAGTVKVNNAFANDGTTVEMPYAEGETNYGDPVAFLNAALERAETGEGQTVNVVLGDNMVFDAYTVIGAESSNHVGKVVITSNPVGTYGIKLKNNPVVTMYGNYEFSNMLLETESLSSSDRYDNALVFPDDCSAVFGEGIAKTESAKPLNIAGNVTVNSGTYCYIAGNAKGSGVKIAKELNITVQGSTVTNYVVGGMIEGAGNGGEVNAKSNVKILGDTIVNEDVIASGRYTSNSGTAGADVIINTNGKINRVIGILGSLSEAAEFNIRLVNADMPRETHVENEGQDNEKTVVDNVGMVAGAVLNDGGTAGKKVVRNENGEITTPGTVINFYLDGGSIDSFYGGLYTEYSGKYYIDLDDDGKKETSVYVGANGGYYTDLDKKKVTVPEATYDKAVNNALIQGEVNIYLNKNEKIDGITYSEPTTITNALYAGSNFSVYNSEDATNKTITLYTGTAIANIYGGSCLDLIGTKHTGKTTIEINEYNNGTTKNSIYGGSYIASNATHSGDVEINVTDSTISYSSGSWAFITGGSNIRSNGTHSGDTVITIDNFTTTKKVVGGSYFQGAPQGIHSGDSTVIMTGEKASNLNGDNLVGGSVMYHGVSDITKYGHRGNSKVVVELTNTGDSDTAFASTIIGGSMLRSYNKVASVHAGNSEVEIKSGKISKKIYAGSYIYADAADSKHSGNATLTLGSFTEVEGQKTYATVISTDALYAGCYIAAASAVHEGNTYVNVMPEVTTAAVYSSTYSTVHSTYNDDATDTDARGADCIKYGFGHVGNVYVNVTGGNFTSVLYGSGAKCNIDGEIDMRISDGTFANLVCTGNKNGAADTNYTSVTGDCKLYISGGTFNGAVYNGGSNAGSATTGTRGGYNVFNGFKYTEISGGTFNKHVYAGGDSGSRKGIYLKLIGDKFDISNEASYLWSNGWSGANLADGAVNSPTILDLSLVTHASYNDWFASTDGPTSKAGIGVSSATDDRGWSTIYPALSNANEISVTMTDTTFNNGEKLALTEDDMLNIKYANPVLYNHIKNSTTKEYTGAYSTCGAFESTYGTLTAWDDFASCEEAKNANAIKFYTLNSTTSEYEEIELADRKKKTVYVGVGEAYSEAFTLTIKAIARKSMTLEYLDMINVVGIFGFENLDLTGVDLSKDAGLLCYSVEEFEALEGKIEFDEKYANAGFEPYPNSSYYCGRSPGIFTRDLHRTGYYVGYIKLADGTYYYTDAKEYSPITYAINQKDKTSVTQETRDLCVQLLNYIAAAQQYFYSDVQESELANYVLTAEQKAMDWSSVTLNTAPTVPTDKAVAQDKSVYTGRGKNLLFEAQISIVPLFKISDEVVANAKESGTIFWTAEQFAALEGVPGIDNYGEGTIKPLEDYSDHDPANAGDDQWCSIAPPINAKEMADTVMYYLSYIVDAEGNVHYSGTQCNTVENYINSTVTKPSTTPAMAEFAKRLYYYERATKAALSAA